MEVWMNRINGELVEAEPLYQKYIQDGVATEPMASMKDFSICLEDSNTVMYVKAGMGIKNRYGVVFLFPDSEQLRSEFENLGEL